MIDQFVRLAESVSANLASPNRRRNNGTEARSVCPQSSAGKGTAAVASICTIRLCTEPTRGQIHRIDRFVRSKFARTPATNTYIFGRNGEIPEEPEKTENSPTRIPLEL